MILRRIRLPELRAAAPSAVDDATLAGARAILDHVARDGAAAVRHYAETFSDLPPGAPLVVDRDQLDAAARSIPAADLDLLRRTADRIAAFARAQRAALPELDVAVPGGRAGHTVAPVEAAGCYAPGGRFPLPSSVLMTAVTARVAGVPDVTVASPRPTPITLAAAAVAGADRLLAVGGAQAIAALAYGAGVPRANVVVGPGNRWVTAAKQLISGIVGIDMLAGPSELVVIADATADPEIVAADLLAQAEHDPDARPYLVTPSDALADAVDRALADQLRDLPTAEIAAAALAHGACVRCDTLDEAIDACNLLAPEHLEVLTADPDAVRPRLRHYGALFLGVGAAEVLGDYGVGPNHVLPTGGTSRHAGGLSVFAFLRVRTWLRMDDSDARRQIAADAERLALLEGLHAHARSAALRK
jgi:histidinol dehydrogenase